MNMSSTVMAASATATTSVPSQDTKAVSLKRDKNAASSQGENQDKSSFHDVLDQTQKGSESDPLTAAASASQQGPEKESATEDDAKDAAGEKQGTVLMNPLLLALLGNVSLPQAEKAATAEGASLSSAAKEPSSAIQTPALETLEKGVSLENLLPVTGEVQAQASQNQQLMDLLSGKSLNAAMPETAGNAIAAQNQTVEPMPTPVVSTASSELTQDAVKMPVVQETAGTLPLTAGKKEGQQANNVKAEEGKTSRSTMTSLLGNASLTVEQKPAENPLQQDASKNPFAEQQKAESIPARTAPAVSTEGEKVNETSPLSTADKSMENVPTAASSTTSAPVSFQQNLQNLLPVDGTATANDVQQAAKDADIPKQIVEQAKLIKSTENTEMVIKLKPEHLGELTLKVSVTAGGAVNASFHSDNAQVRNVIEASMVQLKQELQSQGLKVDNVGVYAGLSDGFFTDSQQPGQQNYPQQQTSSVRSTKADAAAFEDGAESLAAIHTENTAVASNDGVDYRI